VSARYLLRRLIQLGLTTAAILVGTFLLVHLAPGDPIVALAGEHGDPGYYAEMRARFGLDQPLGAQLATYVGNVATGDLGVSYTRGRPALGVVLERVPATLLLAGTALVLSTGIGVLGGVVAGRWPERAPDLSLRGAALVGYATPSFWLAQLAVLVLAFRAGWFPITGMTDARSSAEGLALLVDVAHHLALPAAVLATAEIALNIRLVRGGLLAVAEEPYMLTARAKGLPERRVLRHALRNALLPVVTVLGGRVAMVLTGAVLVEIVFGWPGIGRLLLTAAQARDHPVLLAIFLLVAGAVVVTNLVVDLLYTTLDPRIRLD
jgi:peptide/nickel transport system permease protein